MFLVLCSKLRTKASRSVGITKVASDSAAPCLLHLFPSSMARTKTEHAWVRVWRGELFLRSYDWALDAHAVVAVRT